jgi:YD repeat-containing protein
MKLTKEFLTKHSACALLVGFVDFHNLWKHDFNDLEITGDYKWYIEKIKRMLNQPELEREESYTHDENGNKLTYSRWCGVDSYCYDVDDNMTLHTDYRGRTQSWTYDENGNMLSHTDYLGRTESYLYDSDNNRTTYTDIWGKETHYTYDGNGNKLSCVSDNGRTMYWTYDDNGNMLTFIDVNDDEMSWTYDAVGNVLTHTGRDLRTMKWAYDSDDKLIYYRDFNGDHYSNQNLPDGVLAQVFNKDNEIILEIKLIK